MKDSEKSAKTELVPCEVCLKEVPHSETEVEEVSDYVLYFCGLECYEKWHNEKEEVKD